MEQKNSVLRHIWSEVKPRFYSFQKILKEVSRSPLFYCPLILKIVASFFFASTFATDLFVPFIQHFVQNPFDNPYQHFYNEGIVSAFPNPFLMLAILSPLYAVWSFFDSSVLASINHAAIFILRIPILLADVGILLVLVSWFKHYQKQVLILYWASPILFYISYVHGQLDAIPIFLLFTFLYLLSKEYDYLALVILGFAIATKTGMVIVMPFIALYLIKERRRSFSSLLKICVPFVVFAVVNIPVLFSKGFTEMVFKTKEGFKVFNLFINYNQELALYIIPAICLLLLFYFSTLKRYSRDVLVSFLAFSFFILLLCISPRQGWYFWVIPFAVYFYVQKPWREWFPFYLISIAYFAYFAVIKESDFVSILFPATFFADPYSSLYWHGFFLGLPMDAVVSIIFSFLQGVLLLNIYIIYRDGIAFYTKRRLYYKPFLLAIAGDSGSGKTTLSELLESIFLTRNTTTISGDDMHKWERGNSNWQDYTHLDPTANELHADIGNLYTLKKGGVVVRRQYDHATGKFTLPRKLEAKRLIIFEGLHSLFLGTVRKALDLKIYVAPEDQLRLHWKVIRDSEKRGYTKEQTLAILEKRKDDSEKFIVVQEKHSDIVVSLRNSFSLGKGLGEKDTKTDLSLFMTCSNSIDLQPLLNYLIPFFAIDYLIYDEKQRIKFTGEIHKNEVKKIAENLFPELDTIITGGSIWESDYQGVMQLFVTFYMFQLIALEEYDR